MTAVYDRIGIGYAELRRPDPRISAVIFAELGDAVTVLNVGAGAGSYEPAATVVALEPSAVMIAQRPARSAPAVQGVAEALPFADGAFDAALAVLTTHHWPDGARGLAEMARVSCRQVVLTWDKAVVEDFWLLRDYLPEIGEAEAELPALETVLAQWPGARVLAVLVPWDCTDGFLAAYWRRPEAYLRPEVRAAISSFARLDDAVLVAALDRLRVDLDAGSWDARNAELLGLEGLDAGYRLVVHG